MKSSCKPVPELAGFFPEVIRNYVVNDKNIRPFFSEFPDKDGYLNTISKFNEVGFDRATLQKVLTEQHKGIWTPEVVTGFLNAIGNDKTFTVCTGHQLQLFGGPLYFIHKIVSVVKLARELNELSNHNIIPVFWLASEDHDKEEVSSVNFPEGKVSWVLPGNGPVGRLILNNPAAAISEILRHLPQGSHSSKVREILEVVYQEGKTLAEATRDFIYSFFKENSPLVIDPDHPELKRQYIKEMSRELKEDLTLSTVTATNKKLVDKGVLKAESDLQVNPRSTGLFYLGDGDRVRIERVEKGFKAGRKKWSLEEMGTELNATPENFSPDVLNRPVYQQKILPNLGYIGGPAEIKYWLQLKDLFEAHGVAFPILHPRNSFYLMDEQDNEVMENLNILPKDLAILPVNLAKKRIENTLPDSNGIWDDFKSILHRFEVMAAETDKTLVPSVAGHGRRAEKALQGLEKKIHNGWVRHELKNLEPYLKVHASLFPYNSPQERVFNFLPYYALLGDNFIDSLLEVCNPFDFTPCLVEMPLKEESN